MHILFISVLYAAFVPVRSCNYQTGERQVASGRRGFGSGTVAELWQAYARCSRRAKVCDWRILLLPPRSSATPIRIMTLLEWVTWLQADGTIQAVNLGDLKRLSIFDADALRSILRSILSAAPSSFNTSSLAEGDFCLSSDWCKSFASVFCSRICSASVLNLF